MGTLSRDYGIILHVNTVEITTDDFFQSVALATKISNVEGQSL